MFERTRATLHRHLGEKRVILDDEGRPLVPIYVCWNEHEAELVASILREYSIRSQLNSEIPHSILPLTTDSLGKVEILVREGHADRAAEILSEHKLHLG